MDDFSMTIGGQAVAGPDWFEVENPAAADVIAAAPECTHEQLDLAMRAGQDAQADWQADGPARRAALAALADAVEAELEELALVITREQGKPLDESRAEISDAISDLRYFAALEVTPEVIGHGASAVTVLRRPLGTVARLPRGIFRSGR